MKKIIIVIQFLFVSTQILAQNIIKTYHDPLYKTKLKEVYEVIPNTPILNGNYKLYDQYGYLLVSANFIKNKKQGTLTKYYGVDDCTFLLDEEIKQHIGKISGIYNYNNDELTGKQTTFKYTKNGVKYIDFERIYNNGVEISSTQFYSNGKVNSKIQINGKCVSFYENGLKKEEYNLKNNEYEGEYTSYHPNGNKFVNGVYENSLSVGTWLEFYEDNTLKTKNIYEGKLLVEQITNFKNGKLKWELKKINDSQYIENTYDSISNQITITQEFSLEGTSKKQHGLKKHFFNNGKIKLIEKYKNGDFTGELTKYFENGNVEEIFEKTEDQNLLKNIKYNLTGTKIHEIIVKKNSTEKHGIAIIYNPNETIKETGEYSSNKKVGEWKYFDSEGKLEYVENNINGNRIKKDIESIKNEEIKEYLESNISTYERNKKQIEKLYSLEDVIATKILGETTYKKTKKHLYNAYELCINDIEARLNSSNLGEQKQALIEGIKLTDKMIILSNKDTDNLEKRLKKEKSIESIKTILYL